ncbi:carbamoyltransferase C-terminal domain-containing protein [Desulfosediminicola flagellatus]|uniref:carbamoyltransferase C-terminal domain-containing protein n=1 Tax=Desulfosediminicola flagellatus TaxID=2569541 RepID=UPI0010AC4FB0|nr:carbamoyltransferase C-terminal domain-containing protein [Desulfosediminicola flagellatus]
MKTVSIHLGHNATVALFEDGRVMAVLSQERCDNIKNSAAFPAEALYAILSEIGWTVEDLDNVCICGKQIYPTKVYDYLFSQENTMVNRNWLVSFAKNMRDSWIGRTIPYPFDWMHAFNSKRLRGEGGKELSVNLQRVGLSNKPIVYVDHHECHARSAYHALETSEKQQQALIFTMDGSGDDLCATVTIADGNGRWERIAVTPPHASLGGIYSNTTRFLGMKILEHEYKVMGLAPYAKEQYMLSTYERVFKPVIRLSDKNSLTFESTVNASTFYDYLCKHGVGERFDNLSAALQYLTETLVTQWIANGIKQTGISRVFTGGGVFMNVKLNRKIQEMKEVEQVFFMPSCGDESNPIGAGYHQAVQSGVKPEALDHLYLGLSYLNSEIEEFLVRNDCYRKFTISQHDDIEEVIAGLLSKREIVARFAGRCEWGARSLGNRAILAHPSHMESFYTVNDYIKSRDFWMPFAPSILDSAASRYLKGYDPQRSKAPHMITAFAATELGVDHLRAALHQGDHTLRPQVVEEVVNSSYYKLISMFEEKTGVGAVLNTSLNLHGYPLAATPEQALSTFENSGLMHIALGSFLMSKK